MKHVAIYGIILCLLFFMAGAVCAQEEAGPEYAEEAAGSGDLEELYPYEEADFAIGSLVSVNRASNMLTLNELDWASNDEVNVIYHVAPDVEVEGAGSWKNIKLNTYLEVDYVMDAAGKKTVKSIKISEDEDY